MWFLFSDKYKKWINTKRKYFSTGGNFYQEANKLLAHTFYGVSPNRITGAIFPRALGVVERKVFGFTNPLKLVDYSG